MQASMEPYSLHHSVNANALQSASQTFPRRRTIPPASSRNPPIVYTPGGAKPGRLWPDCAQASTPVLETTPNTNTATSVQYHEQSLVFSLFSSSNSLPPFTSDYVNTTTVRTNATWKSSPVELCRLTTNHNDKGLAFRPTIDANHVQLRGLTQFADARCSIMTSMVSMPGSPPELTESQSSKSSYDSHFSTENDLSQEITNFEDIGLGDDGEHVIGRSHQNGHRQVKVGARRDTYHNRRSTLPDVKCQPETRTAAHTPRSAIVPPMKRGFTTLSSIPLTVQNSRTRTSSPPKRMPRSISSYSVNLGRSTMESSTLASLPSSRRGSWQPQRKTIEDIEAEYHDSDDELPDDANLWNVPISPFHSTNVSPRSSFRGSPEQDPTSTSPQPIPLEHVQSAPDMPHSIPSYSQPRSRHRLTTRSSSANASRSSPTSPRMPTYLRDGRTKSWNVAMADLSDEAKVVSQNLVHHADASRLIGEQSGKPLQGASHRSSSSAIQLPPIQRGPLDFMPMSKEKEAVLSRTRPSWLPPKDPREEQKHLKEYQRMMAASIEAEKKKESKSKTTQFEQEKTRESLSRIWDFYINPTTDISVIDTRINDLCWRGLPSKVRGQVWQRTVGNPLGLTSKTYSKALERANAIKAKKPQDLSQIERSITSWLSDIDRDAETAFPELGLYRRNGPLWQDLISVCEAYTCYRSDIGYLYGLQLIGALILLQIPDPSEAFIFMANCLNKPAVLAFHTNDVASTQRIYNRVVSNLGIKFPKLHDYLFESMESGGLGLTGQELLEPMFRTLFSNGLDFDRLCRIWDVWVFQGDRTLVRTAVAVLGSLQSQIFNVSGDSYLKRRNVQEMLGWGPFNRSTNGSYWKLDSLGSKEAFVEEVESAGKLDYTGR